MHANNTTFMTPASRDKPTPCSAERYTTQQTPEICTTHGLERAYYLLSESCTNIVRSPVGLYFPRVYVLVDPNGTIVDIVVLLFTLFEHLEDEIPADGLIVRVAKVLIHSLLEGLDAFSNFFSIVRMDKLLED